LAQVRDGAELLTFLTEAQGDRTHGTPSGPPLKLPWCLSPDALAGLTVVQMLPEETRVELVGVPPAAGAGVGGAADVPLPAPDLLLDGSSLAHAWRATRPSSGVCNLPPSAFSFFIGGRRVEEALLSTDRASRVFEAAVDDPKLGLRLELRAQAALRVADVRRGRDSSGKVKGGLAMDVPPKFKARLAGHRSQGCVGRPVGRPPARVHA